MHVVRRYWSALVLAACVTAALVFRRFVFVAYYPVGMSAFLALSFGLSLLGRRPLCLVLAEALPPHLLPEGAERYCRRLTEVWTLVLVANGLIALATVFGPRWAWFAWNCALSYGLMGAMILGERLVRRRVFSVKFHTSGSTATPKTIVKTFESLAAEVVFHREHTVAAALATKPVLLSTIEPQHMYGMLWRVLLPRAAGCAVDPEIILTPEALVAKMRAAEKVLLVTTPSFLAHFCAYAAQYEVPQNCVAITTSGALLTADVSAAARRVFGVAPLEVFGSTETGGVAWRRQGEAAAEFDWEVFGPVQVARNAEGRLVVTSPFSCAKGFVMGDGVEMAPDGRHFRLLGRMDRLVKIAEQRVSLPEMETKVASVPGVRETALVALEGAHGPVLGAVVVPDFAASPTGLWGVKAEDRFHKRALALALRQKLLPLFPKGTVPRKYRFVHALPRNAQGKVRTEELRRLFGPGVAEPFVLETSRSPGQWEGLLAFDSEASYFQGHFPGFPVLAGVVQLAIAKHFTEALVGRVITLSAVKKMKFTGVVCPEDQVCLKLNVKSEHEVAYSFLKKNAVCASGVLVF